MRIPPGVILLWFGNEADIPSGWIRETALDGLFPKGWGDEPVGQAGGSDTHTHIGDTHTHNLSNHTHYIELRELSTVEYDDTGGSSPQRMCGQHYHHGSQYQNIVNNVVSDVVDWPNGSNIPPYKDVIFIRANAENCIIEEGIGALFDREAPAGWLKPVAYNQKFLRGADAGNNAGGEGGSYTHTHDLSHNHTHSHYHTGKANWQPQEGTHNGDPNTSGGRVAIGHGHDYSLNSETITYPTFNYVFTSQAIQPVFKKLLVAYRNAGGVLASKGLIALWLGDEASVPKGWVVCDGRYWSDGKTRTPDLRNYFIKLTTDVNRIGETDDSDAITTNSHDHTESIAHTHGGVNHNHGGVVGWNNWSDNTIGTGAGGAWVVRDHYHTNTFCDYATVSLETGYLKTNGIPVNNEPPYKRVIFIQLEKLGVGGSAGALML